MKSWAFEVIVPVARAIFEFLQNASNPLAVVSLFAVAGFVLSC
jgi:hypothetical protein